jgi:hypothetical protein
MYVCMCVCMYLCTCVRMYIRTHTCLCACVHVCVCACVLAHICTSCMHRGQNIMSVSKAPGLWVLNLCKRGVEVCVIMHPLFYMGVLLSRKFLDWGHLKRVLRLDRWSTVIGEESKLLWAALYLLLLEWLNGDGTSSTRTHIHWHLHWKKLVWRQLGNPKFMLNDNNIKVDLIDISVDVNWTGPSVWLMCSNKQNSVAFSPQANYTNWVTATYWWNLVPTFLDRGVSRGQRGGSLTVINLSFLDRGLCDHNDKFSGSISNNLLCQMLKEDPVL